MTYDSETSYCGAWSGNALRTRLKIHKILPFNSCCYAHDCDYNALFSNKCDILQLLKLKTKIDYAFLRNMLKVARVYQIPIALIFWFIVTISTPIYFFRYR